MESLARRSAVERPPFRSRLSGGEDYCRLMAPPSDHAALTSSSSGDGEEGLDGMKRLLRGGWWCFTAERVFGSKADA